jgi:hypothetical protein
MSSTYCSEVLSLSSPARAHSEAQEMPDGGRGPGYPPVRVLLIVERVEGFFLQRLSQSGEHLSETRHDTLDEAMSYAYSEYDTISDWKFCPVDADPLEYLGVRSRS